MEAKTEEMNIEQLEGKVEGLMEKLSAIRDSLLETATQALQAL